MMRLFAGLLLLATFACHAQAAPVATVSWNAPTTYTDQSPVKSGDIASYIVSWSRPTGPIIGSVTVTAPAVTTGVPVPCGSFVFTVSATTSATALYPNTTSAQSNAAPYISGVTCTLNPPTSLTAK